MFSRTIKKVALILAIPVLLVGFAAPASAQSSLSSEGTLSSEYSQLSSGYAQFFSQYSQEQGLFSPHTLALIGATFSSDLTEEQGNALWFGPTDEQQAFECREKYGLNGNEPRPAIAVRMDCSTEVIDTALYEEAVDIARAAPADKLFGSIGSSSSAR